MSDKKVEFIESYIKHGNTDYEWIDNHGELIRCKDCKHNKSYQSGDLYGCELGNGLHDPDWYCADGERREDDD